MQPRPSNVLLFPSVAQPARLPGPRDRVAIMGRTGSGKTHFASWLLSQSDWDKRPWVIIDYKRDDLLSELPGLERLDVNPRRLPKAPGLYRVTPRPNQEAEVESLLERIWSKGNTGLYVDEGHMLPDRGGLQSLLTQGRSKRIPVIVLTQRPSWVNRFVFSEADFFSVFHLNDRRDRDQVGSFMPDFVRKADPLPARHSWYYDVGRNRLVHMLPVPDRNAILDRFERRSPKRLHKEML